MLVFKKKKYPPSRCNFKYVLCGLTAKELLRAALKDADSILLKILVALRQKTLRNVYYLPAISVIFSLCSTAVFVVIFLAAFLMHKKMKEWFPSEKDHKDALKNINNDNTPDTRVEPEFAKQQQPANAANQLLQSAMKQQSQNGLDGKGGLPNAQQENQPNTGGGEETPPVELSKKEPEGSQSYKNEEKTNNTKDVKDVKNAEKNADKKNNNEAFQDVEQRKKRSENQSKKFLNLRSSYNGEEKKSVSN